MIIFVGGLPGSGRKILARELSKRLGFYHFQIKNVKQSAAFLAQHRSTTTERGVPFSDDLHLRIYKRVARDFPLLSKMYPDVIVDDFFHRTKSRNFLFREARKYFKLVVVVWVKGDGESMRHRISKNMQHKSVARRETAFKKLSILEREFEPFAIAPIVIEVKTDDAIQNAVEELTELIHKETGILLKKTNYPVSVEGLKKK